MFYKQRLKFFKHFFSAEKCLLSDRIHRGDLILLAQESGQVGAPDGGVERRRCFQIHLKLSLSN